MNSLFKLITAFLSLSLSSHAGSFLEASKHLDTDGSLIGYVNFEGDGEAIGTQLNAIYNDAIGTVPGMMPIPVDFPTLFDHLGFGCVQAMGISSKELEGDVHANRSVVLLDGEPTGLMALYGSKESPTSSFTAAELAPADATAAISGTVELGALRDTIVSIVVQVMGPMGEGIAQTQLAQPIPGTDLTPDEVINALSGRWDAFWQESYNDDYVPSYKAWLRIDGAGAIAERLQALAADSPILITETKNGLIADLRPILGTDRIGLFLKTDRIDGSLSLYTHEDWGPESEGPRLNTTESYQALAKHLPENALMYSYTAGSDMSKMLAPFKSDPSIGAYIGMGEKAIDLLLGDFLEPAIAAMYFDGDALVTDSYAGYSTKQAVMVIPAAFGGGLAAAMAIPAFQKVRSTSQEKAITNNLRQIASAAQQHMLETGVSEVRYADLIGENGTIRELVSVAGERYEGIVVTEHSTTISVSLPDGRAITYDF
ncbi:MAG: hypothetical protein ACPGKS_02195 [Coraliomargarita sp.]